MTTYAGIKGSHYLEYGYGVGYGMCYGSVSSHLGWHMISDEVPQDYTKTGTYPNPTYFHSADFDANGAATAFYPAGGLSFSSQAPLISTAHVASTLGADNPLIVDDLLGVLGTSVQRYFLYDQIHIIPNIFSLGALANDQQVVSRVWSAFFTEKVATAVSYYNADGFADDLSGALPYTFKKLGEREWYFDIDANSGPAVIAAKISVIIDGETYQVDFTGVRAQSWIYPHNWKDPVTETLEWKTSVVTTYDGTESRAALIDTARRSFEYSMYLKKEIVQKMDNSAFGWQNKVFMIPIHTYFSQLTQAASIGDTTIYLDTVDKGFSVNGYASLYNESTGSFESVTVTGKTDTSLTLLSPLTANWSKYATIFVAAAAYIEGNMPITWQTNNFAEGHVRFQLMPADSYSFTPSVAASNLYRNEEVLTREPDWASGIEWDMSYESGIIDSGITTVFRYETHKRPKRTMQHSWLLKGLSDIRQFREFLYRRRGMAVSFWMPSWKNDFRSVDRSYLSGNTQFEFHDDNYILMSAGKVERQHIQIELNNGAVHRAKIASYTETSPGIISITLNVGFPFNFSSTDIKRASWLSRHRLDSDAVQIEWVHARLAKVTIPIASVPDYPTQDAA